MAEALLRDMSGDEIEVNSAGTEATRVHPMAIEVLEEIGIDTSELRSKSAEEFLNEEIDIVVTVCDSAREACPFFPGARKYLHRSFPDPPVLVSQGMEDLTAFRKVRDMISDWLRNDFSP
jgi:arsenate reductase